MGDEVHRRHRPAEEYQLRRQRRKRNPGYRISRLANHARQPFQLDLQRRINVVIYLRAFIYFAVSGRIADFLHFHHSMSIDHRRPAHHHVRGIGCIRIKLRLVGCLPDNRLACQRRFVYLQRYGFEQMPVRRDFLARPQDYDIAYYDILARHFLDMSVANDLHQNIVVHRIQYFKCFIGFHLEYEAYAACQQYGEQDTYGLEERRQPLRLRPPAMYARYHHRQHPRYQQDADNRVFEFF